jgi:hypothetical protein
LRCTRESAGLHRKCGYFIASRMIAELVVDALRAEPARSCG